MSTVQIRSSWVDERQHQPHNFKIVGKPLNITKRYLMQSRVHKPEKSLGVIRLIVVIHAWILGVGALHWYCNSPAAAPCEGHMGNVS